MTAVKALGAWLLLGWDLAFSGGGKGGGLGVRSACGRLWERLPCPPPGLSLGAPHFTSIRARSALPAARQTYGRLGHLVEVSLDYRQGTPAAKL